MTASVRLEQIRVGLLAEGEAAGLPAVFIDLAGCRISCSIDCRNTVPTADDNAGHESNINELSDRILAFGLRYVAIGGGEPLLQEGCPPLARELSARGYFVHLESNATVDLSLLPRDIVRVIEIKCPSVGTCYHVDWQNLRRLGPYDVVKFPVMDRNDYVWARDVIHREALLDLRHVYMVPAGPEINSAELAQWILADQLHVRLSRPLDPEFNGAPLAF
jgi:7-carboxy-7-deazaguanine synthase